MKLVTIEDVTITVTDNLWNNKLIIKMLVYPVNKALLMSSV